ncbi:glycolate oxidase, subunit GlcF [Rhizobium etli CNPAF512]|nr:glycolate oxidase, subunit GlcF [Rhizobium etli CNPAF512]
MGKAAQSHAAAATAINAFTAEIEREGLDAIVINTSGCGTTVKDYAHMFRDDPLAGRAARVAALAKDITELMNDLGGLGQPLLKERLRVGYHAACSLQHGQQIKSLPKDLLKSAGFEVFEPKDAHICCGSAGTYNLMQPAISAELRTRKVKSIELVRPDVICAGNIGCMVQIGSGTDIPLVHTVELLDWATGGPRPRSLPSAGPQAHEGGSR